MVRRRALMVGNGDDFDGGFVAHRFRQHGYAFVECHRDQPEHWSDAAAALDDVELVVVLGSEWNVYGPETAGAVDAEADLLRDVIDRGTPLFAMCFGAQILSHALGGVVERMAEPEIGWRSIDLSRRNGGAPPAAAGGPWMEWHYDGFTVPDGFTELGRNAFGPQLMVGRRAVATQFHPEATATMVERWLDSGGAEQLRAHRGDPDELRAETRANVASSRARADDLVDWFLADVARS